jgi:hypothetical protein
MKVIPCPHQSGAVADHYQEAPNHYPLTKEEIAELLKEAQTSKNPLTSQIQIRLCQGIPGYVCPKAIDGPVSDKENEISELYVENYRKGADPELVEKIYTILMR